MNSPSLPRRNYLTLDRTVIERIVGDIHRNGIRVLTGWRAVRNNSNQIPVHMPTLSRLACSFPILRALQEHILGELKK